MRKRTWLAAISLTTLALGPTVNAQQPATLVLLSGEHVSGELLDMGADFTMRVNGNTRHYAIGDVVVIDFVGGGSGLPDTELNTIPSLGHLTVLRSGGSFTGRLKDIAGNPMQFVFSTDQGERRVEASNIGRVYLSRPNRATGTSGIAAQASTDNRKTIHIPGNTQWVDTGLNVRDGQVVNFSSSGEILLSSNPDDKAVPPGSLLGRTEFRAPMRATLAGALIGRIGNGRAFGIGDQTSLSMPASGRLALGINDSNVRDNSGHYMVTLGY
jgi:hypothetical protein